MNYRLEGEYVQCTYISGVRNFIHLTLATTTSILSMVHGMCIQFASLFFFERSLVWETSQPKPTENQNQNMPKGVSKQILSGLQNVFG